VRFQSTWKPEIEDGSESAKLDIDEGTHSPPLADMSEELQSLIAELVSAAEAILDEFTTDMAKNDAPRQFSVDASGYLNEGNGDGTHSTATLNVEQVA